MKTFTVIGWYRIEGEKDFESAVFKCETLKMALMLFLVKYENINFYKLESL